MGWRSGFGIPLTRRIIAPVACRSSARAFDSRLLRFSEKQTLHVAIAYLAVQRVTYEG